MGVGGSGTKPKKNRKSPGPGDFDGRVSREDVQSPAYSDISDDSTPVVEQEMLDKSVGQAAAAKHIELLGKKPPEVGVGVGVPPAPAPNMYVPGMYQFYPAQQQAPPQPPQQPQPQPYMVQTEPGKPPGMPPALTPQQQQQLQPGAPPPTSQASSHLLGPPVQPQSVAAHLADYSGKNKDPPLDLMTKPQQPGQQPPPSQQPGQQPGQPDNQNNGKDGNGGPPTSQAGSQPPPVNLSAVAGPPPGALPPGLGGISALGAAGLGGPGPGKGLPHYYPFK